jgi:hypothetical protein
VAQGVGLNSNCSIRGGKKKQGDLRFNLFRSVILNFISKQFF